MKCKYCEAEIEETALKCKYCGEWVQERYSNIIPTEKLFILSFFSAKIYDVFWFWKNLKALRKHFFPELSVFLNYLGLFIPFLNIYFFWKFFDRIKIVAEKYEVRGFSPVLATLYYFVSSALIVVMGPWRDIIDLIFVVCCCIINTLVLMEVQEVLNAVWRKVQPRQIVEENLSLGEGILIIIGIVIWIFFVLSVL